MANKVFDAIGLGGLGNFGLGDILNTVNDVGAYLAVKVVWV